ncbi:hypothetical protein [Candidatus Electronema sp. JM]|uniref:hypothetical protein n=1 Tax=Candidatus Electronema sp. JM TaxID=3401571 RepID=UPI003AA7C23E
MNSQLPYQPAQWEKIVATIVALFIVGLISFLVIRDKPFSDSNFPIFIRILLSLACAVLGAVIPGFLNIDLQAKGLLIRAGGALALFVITYFFTPQTISPSVEEKFPKTRQDQQMTKRLLFHLGSYLSGIDRQFYLFDSYSNEIDSFLSSDKMNQFQYDELYRAGIHTKDEIKKTKNFFEPITNDIITWSSKTPISAADLTAVPVLFNRNIDDLLNHIDFLLKISRIDSSVEHQIKKKTLSNYREQVYQNAVVFWFGLNEILLPINQTNKAFEEIFEPILTMLNFFSKPEMRWLSNKKECQRNQNQAMERLKYLQNELSSMVGDLQTELSEMKKRLETITSNLINWLDQIDKSGSTIKAAQTTFFPLLESVWTDTDSQIGLTPANRASKSKIIIDNMMKDLNPVFQKFAKSEELIGLVNILSKITATSASSFSNFSDLKEYLSNLNDKLLRLQQEFTELNLASSTKEGKRKIEEIQLEFEYIHLWLQFCGAQIQLMVGMLPEAVSPLAFAQKNFNYLSVVSDASELNRLLTKRKELVERKRALLSTVKDEVATIQEATQKHREQIKVKFAISPADDAELVWGKAIRFLSAGFKEECLAALDIYLKRTKDSAAKQYTEKAKKFIQERYPNDYNGGVIVVGFEGRKHSSLLIGDIITAIDEIAVRDIAEFVKLKKEKNFKGMNMSVWRLDKEDHFVKYTISTKPVDPLVGVATLGEVFN